MFANALKKLTGNKEPKELAAAMKDKTLIKLLKDMDSGSSQGAVIRNITKHIRTKYNDLEISDVMAYMLPVIRERNKMNFKEYLQLNESEIDRPAVEKAAMKKSNTGVR